MVIFEVNKFDKETLQIYSFFHQNNVYKILSRTINPKTCPKRVEYFNLGGSFSGFSNFLENNSFYHKSI